MNIVYLVENPDSIKSDIKTSVEGFFKEFKPSEGVLHIFEDSITKAIFCE